MRFYWCSLFEFSNYSSPYRTTDWDWVYIRFWSSICRMDCWWQWRGEGGVEIRVAWEANNSMSRSAE